jgi:hypothetical protein
MRHVELKNACTNESVLKLLSLKEKETIKHTGRTYANWIWVEQAVIPRKNVKENLVSLKMEKFCKAQEL